MAEIKLHKDDGNTATMVPNRFIDEYMTTANGEFVKIYLYLLRCMNTSECCFSISKTADKFEHTEKDIQRALKYWEKASLLHLKYDEDKNISEIRFVNSESTSSDFSPPEATAPPEPPVLSAPAGTKAQTGLHTAEVPSADAAPLAIKEHSYTADEIRALQEKDEVQELLFVAESYLGHVLTPTDIQKLLFWYDELHLSADLIVYLIEYCIAKGNKSLNYMKRIAISWKESGIETVTQAKSSSSAHSKTHYAVMKALGISGRNLVPAETSFIDRWTKDLGFGLDIISEACSRTITTTHQPSFEYTDKILSNWNKQQVHELSDIVKLDLNYQKTKPDGKTAVRTKAPNKFNDFPQRTYDFEKLEAQLLNIKH